MANASPITPREGITRILRGSRRTRLNGTASSVLSRPACRSIISRMRSLLPLTTPPSSFTAGNLRAAARERHAFLDLPIRPHPGEIPHKCLVEVVHTLEIPDRVLFRLRQEPRPDEPEDDLPEVGGLRDAPVLEDGHRHEAELLERQLADPLQEFPAAHVPTLLQAPHDELQGGEHEQVGLAAIARILLDEAVERVERVVLRLAHSRTSR